MAFKYLQYFVNIQLLNCKYIYIKYTIVWACKTTVKRVVCIIGLFNSPLGGLSGSPLQVENF